MREGIKAEKEHRMIFTDFKKGKLRVTCMKTEPTLVILDLDDKIKAVPFETGLGSKEFKLYFNPQVIKATGMSYVPIGKAKKKLPSGEHRTKPKEYSNVPDSEFAGEGYTFPVNSAKRVHSALAYFSKHPWPSSSAKKSAAKKILSAAKKFGIKVDKTDDVYRAAH